MDTVFFRGGVQSKRSYLKGRGRYRCYANVAVSIRENVRNGEHILVDFVDRNKKILPLQNSKTQQYDITIL